MAIGPDHSVSRACVGPTPVVTVQVLSSRALRWRTAGAETMLVLHRNPDHTPSAGEPAVARDDLEGDGLGTVVLLILNLGHDDQGDEDAVLSDALDEVVMPHG